MPRLLLSLFLLPLLLLCGGCATGPDEPVNGCVLAAANRREILRAGGYLDPAIPARILGITFAGRPVGHAALVFRLQSGWWVYDDVFASRRLHLPAAASLPDPILAARAAFPGCPVATAVYLDPLH